MTVSQWRVSARKRRMWRRQTFAARTSQREGASPELVVPVAVVVLVLVLVVEVSVPPAAAAAVAMPANASRSPQARMERRKSIPPQVDCKSEAERAG
jgi:hypothetical protein